MARLMILLAALLWSTSGAFSKSIALDGPRMAFWRAFFAALVLLPFLRRRPPPEDRTRDWRSIFMMMLCFSVMNLAFITAMTMTTAANVIFLQYTAPLFIAMAAPFLGEAFDKENWLPLALGTIGVGVLMWGSDPRTPGVWLALLAGLSYAGVAVFLRKLRDEDPIWLTVLNHGGAAIVVGLFLVTTRAPLAVSVDKGMVLLAFGALQMAVPYLLFANGLKTVSAQEAGVLTLFEPLFNPIVTYLVVQEVPTARTLWGGAFLLSGVGLRLARSMRGAWRTPGERSNPVA